MSSSTTARGRRHRASTVATARRLHDAGWTPHEIQKHLGNVGITVAFATVKAWVDEDYRVLRNRITAEDQRRYRDKSGEHVRRRMLELAKDGLKPKAISAVIRIYHGRNINEEQVRYFLNSERDKRDAANEVTA